MEAIDETVLTNRYPAYKDSGVDWLGEVPAHWELTRLGTRFSERKQKVSDKDYAPLSVTKQGIVPQLDNAAKTNDGDNRKLVKSGDFVINSRSDRKGSSGISSLDGSVSLINIVLEPKNVKPTYCNYLLKSYNFIEEFYRNGHGIVADLWTTHYSEMKAITVAIPPLAEQTRIAEFLDRKTAQINQAIAQKERLIELLNEQRQVLIHRAVTRGLNPDAPMKDSGIEWIGEIPAHWEVAPLTKYASRVDYRGKTPEKVESGVFLVTTKNIKEGKIDYEISKEYVLDSQYKEIMSRGLPKIGDILFTMEAPLGMSAIVDNPSVAIAQRIIKFRFKDSAFESSFVNYSIQSGYFQKHLQQEGTGSTAVGIKASKLHKLRLLKPNLNEQAKIVSFVNHHSKQTQKAIHQQNAQYSKASGTQIDAYQRSRNGQNQGVRADAGTRPQMHPFKNRQTTN